MRKLLLLVFCFPVLLQAQNTTAFRKNYNYTLFDFPANIVEGLTPNTYILAGTGLVDGVVSQLNDTGGVVWSYNYNALFNDVKKDAANSQYILCGSKSNAAVLVILDASGTVVLSKQFSISEANDAIFSRVIKVSDGGYVAAGYVTGHDPDGAGAEIKFNPITYTDNNGDSQTDYISSPLIVKLDASGNHVWHRVFRYYTAATKDPATERIYNDASFNDVVEVSDGYVAVGNYDVNQHRSATNSDGDDATPTDALIVKTSTAGTVTYHKQVDNPSTSTSQSSKYLSAVNTTSAGAIIAGGTDDSRELIQKFVGSGGFSNTFSRIFRYSTSFFGTVNDPSDVSQIYEVAGGTDLVTMTMYLKPLSFFSNAIHRVSSNAQTNVWTKRYDFTNMFTILPKGSLTSDGGYICASMGAGGGANYDFHVIKTDGTGDTPLTGCPANSFTPTAQAGPTTFADPHYNSWSSGTPGASAVSITRGTISLAPTFVCTQIACTPPEAATTVTATPSAICQSQSSSITASGPSSGVTYNVYSAATGGTFLGSTPLTVSPSSTATYYVETALNSDANCVSTTRTSVTVTVNTAAVPTITADGPTSFCQGGSVTLTSSAAASYFWSNGANSPSITVTTAGSYTVTVTYANSCSNSSAATTVTVNNNPTPTITPSGTTTFCEGGSVTLTSSAASSYSWSDGSTSQSIIVTSSGNYNVTVTDGNGCTGSAGSSVTITVNQNPTPVITGVNSACENSTGVIYSVANNPGNTYAWTISNGTIDAGQSTNSISVTWGSSGAASITLTETNTSTTCSGSNTMNVTINSSLDPLITSSGSTNICENDTVILDAGSGYSTYLWSNGGNLQTISVSTSGTYSVSVTDANGCSGSSSAPVTITVNNNPAPTITPSGSISFCEGNSITLDAGSGYSDYLWNTGETTQLITIDSTGVYSVTVTDANGCTGSSSAPADITVYTNPDINISTSDSTTFCEGNSITLDAGAGYSNYLWNTGDTTQSISVNSSGDYSVSVTDANGCSNDSSATSTAVIVHPLPVTAISGNTPVCNGDTVFLTTSGGISYLWNTGDTTSQISILISQIYFVTVTDSNNCSAVDSADVTVYPEYSIVLSASICEGDSVLLEGNYQTTAGTYYDSLTTLNGCDSIHITTLVVNQAAFSNRQEAICEGDSIFLQGNFQTITGIYYDTLSSAGGCDSIVETTLTVNQSSVSSQQSAICDGQSIFLEGNFQTTSGTYYDTLSTVNGCDSVIATTLTVNPLPTVLITPGNTTLCEGTALQLTATANTGSLLWNTGDTTSQISVTPPITNIYAVSVTDGNSCSASDSVMVTVIPTPVISFENESLITCSNQSIELSVTSTAGNIVWSNGDTGSVITVNPANDSVFYATAFNGNCSASDSVYVTVLPAPDNINTGANASPDTVILYFGDDTTLTATVPANTSFIWSPPDFLNCTDCLTPLANPDSSTVYYLSITAENGCKYTDSVIVLVEYPPSEVFVPNIFSPNGDLQNDILFVYGRYVEGIEITIFDRWGEKIFFCEGKKETCGWDGTYKGTLLNTAVFVYYLKAHLFDGTVIEKQGNITLAR